MHKKNAPGRQSSKKQTEAKPVGKPDQKKPYAAKGKPYTAKEKFDSEKSTSRGNTKSNSEKSSGYKDNKVLDQDWYSDESMPAAKARPIGTRKPYKKPQKTAADQGLIRLNRYLANAGICSRREADQLIASGVVKINGKIVTELGSKVGPGDVVQYGDQTLNREKKQYLLLNKPKNYITTSDDPEGRKTVFELIKNACKERIYPVGRLDRATMGLLLFTNDGDMAKKLSHPSSRIAKIYHVHLDKALKKGDLMKIANGEVALEDGVAEVDEIHYVGDGAKKDEIGMMLHSGKNRIVRRIFEHLGYKVVKLDRVSFAGLTKKDLPRGKFRFLTEKEVNFLKMI
jgi:23S rRNA pseudouridine2605 synthase